MAVDYKHELEKASKTMILVHTAPKQLIKMILRMIVRKVHVSHAGILLHDTKGKSFILTVSRGPLGLKIPEDFVRFDYDNSLIQFFRRKEHLIFTGGIILYDEAQDVVNKLTKHEIRDVLAGCLYQMDLMDSVAAIPAFVRIDSKNKQDELFGVLLLGNKKNLTNFEQEELQFFSALASDVAMAVRNAQLFDELKQELETKQRLFINTTVAFAQAIDAKDHYTHGHTNRVTDISLAITRKMGEIDPGLLDKKFLEDVHVASLLHDVGKIGVPETILNKQGPLTSEEFQVIKQHPVVGANILAPISELSIAIQGVRHHHERYDGRGYPDGLKGKDIPLIAAIISVADAFDAMNSDRPYRKGMSVDQALAEIEKNCGTQFDPQVATIFVKLMREGKIEGPAVTDAIPLENKELPNA